MFLTKYTLPRKYRLSAGMSEVSWGEFGFHSKLQKNGYTVTLAAIVIGETVVLGASACSPEDRKWFDRRTAADRAMGRARQVGSRLLAGRIDEDRKTLLGGEAACVRELPPALLERLKPEGPHDVAAGKLLVLWIEPYYHIVSMNAEIVSFQKTMRRLHKRYSNVSVLTTLQAWEVQGEGPEEHRDPHL